MVAYRCKSIIKVALLGLKLLTYDFWISENQKSFKNTEKCFLFCLKRYYLANMIYISTSTLFDFETRNVRTSFVMREEPILTKICWNSLWGCSCLVLVNAWLWVQLNSGSHTHPPKDFFIRSMVAFQKWEKKIFIPS